MQENDITHLALQCAYKVHTALGPGLLEQVYEACMDHELRECGLRVLRQPTLPVVYKTVCLDSGYRLDLWVEEKVILEIKSVAAISELHFAQLLTYLRLSGCRVGLLLNFNTTSMKLGIKRVVNDF